MIEGFRTAETFDDNVIIPSTWIGDDGFEYWRGVGRNGITAVHWFSEYDYVIVYTSGSGGAYHWEWWVVASPIEHRFMKRETRYYPPGSDTSFSEHHYASNFVTTSNPNVAFMTIRSRPSGSQKVTGDSRLWGYYVTRDGDVEPAGHVYYMTQQMVSATLVDHGAADESVMQGTSRQGRVWMSQTSFTDKLLCTTADMFRRTYPFTSYRSYMNLFSLSLNPSAGSFDLVDTKRFTGYSYMSGSMVARGGNLSAHCFAVKEDRGFRVQFFDSDPNTVGNQGHSHYVTSCRIGPEGFISDVQEVKSDKLIQDMYTYRPDRNVHFGVRGGGIASDDGGPHSTGSRAAVMDDGRILMSVFCEGLVYPGEDRPWWVADAGDEWLLNPKFGREVTLNNHWLWRERHCYLFTLDPDTLGMEWAGFEHWHEQPVLPGVSVTPTWGSSFHEGVNVTSRSVTYANVPGMYVPEGNPQQGDGWSDWMPGALHVGYIDVSSLRPGRFIPQSTPSVQTSYWPGWSVAAEPRPGNELNLLEGWEDYFIAISPSGRHLFLPSRGRGSSNQSWDDFRDVWICMGLSPEDMTGELGPLRTVFD